ncbi:Cysteine-rich PDZ-binding protein [Bienertia sinuspersici]
MVCDKCEKKLAKVIVPDKWKAGASNTNESGGRKINENKLLSKKSSANITWISGNGTMGE